MAVILQPLNLIAIVPCIQHKHQKQNQTQQSIEEIKEVKMQSAKETASNIGASAKAGMEKTKATLQEKTEKMATRDPVQKQMATEKKEDRKHDAEMEKQLVKEQNAASKQAAAAGGTPAFTTGTQQHHVGPRHGI